MKLSPAQFRDALGISQETLRHWRKVLPIFQGRSGYAPVFTPGDLVAGAVIKTVKDHWGLSVSAFADHSVELGRVCNETPWAVLPTGKLVLSLADRSCEFVSIESHTAPNKLYLTVPLAPIIDHLTHALLKDQQQTQKPTYFPPRDVRPDRQKASSR